MMPKYVNFSLEMDEQVLAVCISSLYMHQLAIKHTQVTGKESSCFLLPLEKLSEIVIEGASPPYGRGGLGMRLINDLHTKQVSHIMMMSSI